MALEISTDPTRLDRELVFNFLHEDSYWCKGISRELLEIALRNSTWIRNVERWMAIELTPHEAYEQDPPPPWPPVRD